MKKDQKDGVIYTFFCLYTSSIHNPTEREHIIALCEVLKERGYAKWTGIITPYKMQKEMLREEFTKRQFDKFQIDTVDAYQGKEKGITILSCVRANSAQGNIGFLTNPQRMNVALTRAIESLVILAHCQSLQVSLTMRGRYGKNISVTFCFDEAVAVLCFYKCYLVRTA